jgi:hypothetical protein
VPSDVMPGPSRGTMEQPAYSPGPSPARRALILGACALVGIGVGIGVQRLSQDRGTPTAAPAASSTAAAPIEAKVTSFSVKDSGFDEKNGVWSTQHYRTAEFGRLKPGVGLLLDLGEAKKLREVTFTSELNPITVELRAADEKSSSLDGYAPVGSAAQADGATSLPAVEGGSHRYWLIWVTALAEDPDGGGFAARLGDVAATA